MSLLLGLVFLVQSVVVVYLPLPVIANLISAIHMSLLNSMYWFVSLVIFPDSPLFFSFEYLWSARGSSLNERIFRLEKRWCYFAGFGTFLTFASTFFENFLLNGCVFGAIFPFFIISSYKASVLLLPIPYPPLSGQLEEGDPGQGSAGCTYLHPVDAAHQPRSQFLLKYRYLTLVSCLSPRVSPLPLIFCSLCTQSPWYPVHFLLLLFLPNTV